MGKGQESRIEEGSHRILDNKQFVAVLRLQLDGRELIVSKLLFTCFLSRLISPVGSSISSSGVANTHF